MTAMVLEPISHQRPSGDPFLRPLSVTLRDEYIWKPTEHYRGGYYKYKKSEASVPLDNILKRKEV